MQHQHRPPSEIYHPPQPPSIPLPTINTLIPRLTTTINDIDSLKTLVANGAHNSTIPSWDVLLQRYSLLLGRINALSATITAPPARPNVTAYSQRPPPQTPILSHYLVHPLTPLPSADNSGSEITPLVQDAFFQAINTIPLVAGPPDDRVEGMGPNVSPSHTQDQLRAFSEMDLEDLRRRILLIMERDGMKGKVMKEEIGRRAEEVDWAMRVDEAEEGDDYEDDEPAVAPMKDNDETGDDDDLFGSDDDEFMEVAPATDTAPKQHSKEQQTSISRATWKATDFVKFMDSGAQPL
ncbi:hypothetical protein C345_01897 [Cryptococcus neoformans A2-102-5]|nr:hypothetical protein C346_06026 [Cryptococcus neoformans var. grubii D17-1]OXG98244.1 hypothetical protein C345_01897 [Cryptococcus neoformans var. grubii A2-102-5]